MALVLADTADEPVDPMRVATRSASCEPPASAARVAPGSDGELPVLTRERVQVAR
jgi:hypothetical protein